MPERKVEDLLEQARKGPSTMELLHELQAACGRSYGKISTPVFLELIAAEAEVRDNIINDIPSRSFVFGQQDEDEDLNK